MERKKWFKSLVEIHKNDKELGDTNMDIYTNEVKEMIDTQPTVEQKHGHWKLAYVMSDNDHREFCSNCHYSRFRNNSADWRYCPYCGSKMDEVTDEQ